MKYFVIFLILVGFSGSVFAQTSGNTQDDVWLPACLKESNAGCDHSSLFHNAISEPFAQSDSVAIGTIIQKEKQEQNSIKYSINVDFYLKNYQPFDLVTATLSNAAEPQTFPEVLYYNSPVFNEGDLVFVYLKKIEGQYQILSESFALDKQEARGPPPIILLTKSPLEDNFEQGDEILVSGEVRKMELVKATKDGKQLDVKLTLYDENGQVIFSDLIDIDVDGSYDYDLHTSAIPPGKYELEVNYGPSSTGDEITIEFNPRYWTPLKQLHSEISPDKVVCKSDMVLVQKRTGLSACVTPETREKLVQRSWAVDFPMKYIIDVGYWGSTYLVHHTMCAHIGVWEQSKKEIQDKTVWSMTDEDLEKMPIIKSMIQYNSRGLYSSPEYPITSTVVPDEIQDQYRHDFDNIATSKSGTDIGHVFLYNGKYYSTNFMIC